MKKTSFFSLLTNFNRKNYHDSFIFSKKKNPNKTNKTKTKNKIQTHFVFYKGLTFTF